MKLSVCVITRNHEAWIGRAIESALSQQTDFDFEVVVGEDDSDDRTLATLREFERVAAGRLRVTSRRSRMGLVGNFIQTVEECRGEYIALLDGDDFWTNPDKLSVQSRYLDAHPDCVLSFHQAAAVDPDGKPLGWSFVRADTPERVGVANLIEANCIPSSSVVWRREALPKFPNWFHHSVFEDWPLFLLLSMKGNIHFRSESMSAYRQHPAGLWSSLSTAEQFRRMSSFLVFIQKNVSGLPAPQLRESATHWKCREAEAEGRAGRRARAAKALLEAAWMTRFRFRNPESFCNAWRALGNQGPEAANLTR